MSKDSDKKDPSKIQEPLETYFKSTPFLNSFKRLTISSLQEQEEATRKFSANLTPYQRLEYLYILNQAVFSDKLKTLPVKYTTLHFNS